MLSKETDLDHPCKETCSGWKQGYARGVADQNEALLMAVEALKEIQNAYGSPDDEDSVTTTAREALTKIRKLTGGEG